jgi:alpha-glucosidase
LRGTPVLFQGDEIGLGDVAVEHEDMRDPLGVRYWPHYAGRDAGRTPMHWRDEPGGGFTQPGVTPWLPLGDTAVRNVENQRHDPESLLTFTRDLIAVRRQTPDLHSGSYRTLPTAAGLWAWRRGRHVVVVNLSDAERSIAETPTEGVDGLILIATNRARDGETVSDAIVVRPWEGLVIET